MASIRRYIRHPASIPLDVRPAGNEQQLAGEKLRDISLGGLAFRCPHQFLNGTRVRVRIPLVDPAFDTEAKVVWCRPQGQVFDIGVRFLEPGDLYLLRMVEQVCHIEHYRREVARREGRALTDDQAAAEWIRLYADAFPDFRAPEQGG